MNVKTILKKHSFFVVCVALTACGGGRQAAWEENTASTGARQTANVEAAKPLLEQAEAAFAARDDKAKLEESIALWTQALEQNSSDAETWFKLCRAQYFLADGHLQFESNAALTLSTYESAMKSAERGLAIVAPVFTQKMSAGEKPEVALREVDVRAVPGLYWRASSLGKWARSQDFTTVLQYKDEIRATMTRVMELDRTYFFAGPDRYFGAFFAIAPNYAGGDLELSRRHFEYSISVEPNYFGTHVLFAENLAVKSQKKDEFLAHLNLVIQGNPDALAAVGPENRAEQKKAQRLLARVDELFE